MDSIVRISARIAMARGAAALRIVEDPGHLSISRTSLNAASRFSLKPELVPS